MAYQISEPHFSHEHSFIAFGNDLQFKFSEVNAYSIYRFFPNSIAIPGRLKEKPTIDFANGQVLKIADHGATLISPEGFTKVPECQLHRKEGNRVYFYLSSSQPLSATNTISAGTTISQIAQTSLGRVSTVNINVSFSGIPENTLAVSKHLGGAYGARSGLIIFPNPDGGLAVVWQDAQNKELHLQKEPELSLASSIKKNKLRNLTFSATSTQITG